MDVGNQFLSSLHREHEEVQALLNQIQQAAGSNMQMASDLWGQLKSKLIPHLIAEEKVFYPALKAKDRSRKYGDEAHEQHRAIESGIFELNSLPTQQTGHWTQGLHDFRMRFQQHVQFEETVVFGAASDILGTSTLNQLMTDFQKAENEAKSVTIGGRYEAGFLVG